MEYQVEKLQPFRHILLFEFNRSAKAAEVAKNICAVYGDNTIGESTARKWFSRFKEGRFDISGTLQSGRLSGFEEDRLNTLIHNEPRECTRELTNVMNCNYSTIERHLHSMGKCSKIGCMGTACSKPNPQKSSCSSSIAREQYRPFRSCIVTGDEKLYLYASIRKRKEWFNSVAFAPLWTQK